MLRTRVILLALAVVAAFPATGQHPPATTPYPPEACRSCAEWNVPHAPFKVFGNTYYVGTAGLTALLVTSPSGHVIIDGALPESAGQILANVKTLGFAPDDVKLIVNSHAHFDHAGGIAPLQRATGARVAASLKGAPVIETGRSGKDDPQFAELLDFPAAGKVERFEDGATLTAGPLKLKSYPTGGHTPGGTSWSWESCEGTRCLQVVYADSLTPISDDTYRYSDDPSALAAFEKSYQTLEALRCDILLTPHPAASAMWDRLAAGKDGFVDGSACGAYAARAREQLAKRLAEERKTPTSDCH